MIGEKLIHYEIAAEIGKGGMGEVYHRVINQRGLL
jgi:hypothetical protein